MSEEKPALMNRKSYIAGKILVVIAEEEFFNNIPSFIL